MLVTLGARRGATDGVALLMECHGRIRAFTAMARRLAGAHNQANAAVRDTAAQIRRYFSDALPLHVLDEEETVVGLLAGASPEVDAALARMTQDHRDHAPQLARLMAICSALEREPGQLDAFAAELGPLTHDLEAEFTDHLTLEEHVLFPALRELPADRQAALTAAIRGRPGRM